MKYITPVLFVCSAALLVLAFGCQSKSERKLADAKWQAKQQQERTEIEMSHNIVSPPGSSNLVSLGSGWYTFEFQDKKFLGRSQYRRQVLTQIIP